MSIQLSREYKDVGYLAGKFLSPEDGAALAHRIMNSTHMRKEDVKLIEFMRAQEKRIVPKSKKRKVVVTKGEGKNHPFRGNQWTTGTEKLTANERYILDNTQGARRPWSVYNASGNTIVYHGARKEVAESILENGLHVGDTWMGRPPSVYFTVDKSEALAWASIHQGDNDWALVEFSIPDEFDADIIQDPIANRDLGWRSAYRLEHEVPAKWIKSVTVGVVKYADDGKRQIIVEQIMVAKERKYYALVKIIEPDATDIDKFILKGEGKNHPFRGNQWTTGARSARIITPASKAIRLMSDPNNWKNADQDYKQGVSESVKVKVTGDGKAIVKHGVNKYSGFDANDPYKEEDTYKLCQELGFDVVPPSTVAPDPFNSMEKMGVQQWVDDASTFYSVENSYYEDKERYKGKIDEDSFEQVAWLDAITANTDRHSFNMLVKGDASKPNGLKAVAIDNNLALFTNEKLSSIGRSIYDPSNVVDKAIKLNGAPYASHAHKWSKTYYNRCLNLLKSKEFDSMSYTLSTRYSQTFVDEAIVRVTELGEWIDRNAGWRD